MRTVQLSLKYHQVALYQMRILVKFILHITTVHAIFNLRKKLKWTATGISQIRNNVKIKEVIRPCS